MSDNRLLVTKIWSAPSFEDECKEKFDAKHHVRDWLADLKCHMNALERLGQTKPGRLRP